jgi:hypothetical protein
MQKALRYALVAPLAILLFLAVAGALGALLGSMSGVSDIKQFGQAISVFGAVGFLLIFMTPLGRFLGAISNEASKASSKQGQLLKEKTNA